jgi:hypothetical protein
MKHFLVALLTVSGIMVIFPFPSSSKCKEVGLVSFPAKDARLPLNASIVLSAYGRMTPLIHSIDEYNPRLRSDIEVTRLIEDKVDHRVYQDDVFLRPEKPLRPNTVYFLELDIPDAKTRKLYDDNKLSWTTGTKTDNDRPIWNERPHLKRKGIDDDGRLFAEIAVDAKEDNVAYEIRWKPKGQANWSFASLNMMRKNTITVFGETECSCGGAVRLASNIKWELEIAAIDAGGNRSEANGLVEVEFTDNDRAMRSTTSGAAGEEEKKSHEKTTGKGTR